METPVVVASDETSARLARLNGALTVVLTHRGRRTGKPYDVRIWFLADGDHLYLVTMNMDRQWVQNVQVKPKVSLRIKNEILQGEVAVVSDASEMKRVVGLMKKKYPIALPYLWLKQRPAGAFRVHVQGAVQP
jgi:deazaflavin-dependent oxidoreductase (nitroreductase family)